MRIRGVLGIAVLVGLSLPAFAADPMKMVEEAFKKALEKRQGQKAEVATAAAPSSSVSGVYVFQFKSRSKDGRGKTQGEYGRYRYVIEDLGGGKASVKYEGESQWASPGSDGGTRGGAESTSGTARFKNGIWTLKNDDCEVQFKVEPPTLTHISGLCQGSGQAGEAGWPAEKNTVFKLVSDTHRTTKAVGGKAGASPMDTSAPVSAAVQPAANPFPNLIGKTFDEAQKSLGGVSEEYARQHDGAKGEKVSFYPFAKGAKSFNYVLVMSGRERQERVAKILTVAPSRVGPSKLPWSFSPPDKCSVDGKPTSGKFAFFGYVTTSKPGKTKTTSTMEPAKDGESIWTIEPGTSNVVPVTGRVVCSQVNSGDDGY